MSYTIHTTVLNSTKIRCERCGYEYTLYYTGRGISDVPALSRQDAQKDAESVYEYCPRCAVESPQLSFISVSSKRRSWRKMLTAGFIAGVLLACGLFLQILFSRGSDEAVRSVSGDFRYLYAGLIFLPIVAGTVAAMIAKTCDFLIDGSNPRTRVHAPVLLKCGECETYICYRPWNDVVSDKCPECRNEWTEMKQ